MEVRQTETFKKWFLSLKDKSTQFRIDTRIRRVVLGNFGDVTSLSDGVFELRLDFGPGYRIYFHRRGSQLIFLLAGGDKSTQTKDIAKARAMVNELED